MQFMLLSNVSTFVEMKTFIFVLYLIFAVNGVSMKAKNTTGILKQLRALLKNTQYVSEPLNAYIVLSEDVHQVSLDFYSR